MSTGYYVSTPSCENACEHCFESQRVHLGQTAAGWQFLFHGYDADNADGIPEVRDVPAWLALAGSGPIEDEYGRPIALEELFQRIQERQADPACRPRGPEEGWIFAVDGFEFAPGQWS